MDSTYRHMGMHNMVKHLSKVTALLSVFLFVSLVTKGQDTSATAEVIVEQPAEGPAEDPNGISADPAIIASGKTIFENNCYQCHRVHKQWTGPALKDVYDRQSIPWLISFIKNSQKVIQSGDEYAVNLYNEYSKTVMPNHTFLKDADIMSILAYIKAESANVPVEDTTTTTSGDGNQVAQTQDSPYLTVIFGFLIVVLVLMVIVLGITITLLTKYLKGKQDLDEADKELVEQKLDIQGIFKSTTFMAFVIFIVVALGAKTAIDSLFLVGVQQGYAPSQPIAFSHKIHAGQYEIDCNYCHTGVTKSKNANIPSANICMNCHTSVKTESSEIKKIYAALDYNPETKEYGSKQKPIEWVRVHNLPDLAYFNHSQHVKVAGIECQTCHGPIEEMDVVRQHSKLTMGWCINCHRETEVNTKGNAYYDKLMEVHQKHSKEPMKVEDIGGLECSKCHY